LNRTNGIRTLLITDRLLLVTEQPHIHPISEMANSHGVGFKQYNIKKALHTYTVHLKLTHATETKNRLWLGGKLLKLASKVMGCKIEVDWTKNKNGKQ